jgi:hypothetical protein
MECKEEERKMRVFEKRGRLLGIQPLKYKDISPKGQHMKWQNGVCRKSKLI